MKHFSYPLVALQKAFIVLFLLTISLNAFAQPQQRVWSLPGNEVKFSPLPTASSLSTGATYFGLPPFSASNCMTDFNGNLLFYVLDNPPASPGDPDVVNIYDKDGALIDFLQFPVTGQSTVGLAGEIGLIPVPNACAKYYIVVGVGKVGVKTPYHPEYAILDMAKPNKYDATKKGALEYFSLGVNTINLQDSDPSLNFAWDAPERPGYIGFPFFENNKFAIAITPFRSATNDYFLYINGNVNLYRFVVKPNGIFLDNSATDLGVADIGLLAPNDNLTIYPEMEIIDLGTGVYRLAKIDGASNVRVYDFDSSTGVYIPSTFRQFTLRTSTNPLIAYQGVGLEFVTSGNKLYYTCLEHDGSGIPAIRTRLTGYFDLTASTPTPILFTIPSPPVINPVLQEASFIEKAFDGKMYYNFKTEIMGSVTPELGGWTTVLLPNETIQTLPDQMDGQDYKGPPIFVSYTAGTAGALSYTSYTSSAQAWTPTNNPFGGTTSNPVGTAANPITILGELVIPAGFNVTLQGMNFKFRARSITYVVGVATTQYGARVIVKNSTGSSAGGRLTLANLGILPTILTSDNTCSSGMWEGVDVWGDNLVAQGTLATSKQAWLQLFSAPVPFGKTTISNAYTGATIGKKSYSPFLNIIANTGGGVIQANANTEFLDNQIGVYFMPYNVGNNLSKFTSNRFTTNSNSNFILSPDGATPFAMAYLNDVKGIYFKAVIFTNNALLYPQTSTIGSVSLIGIRSYHSQFYCTPASFTSTVGCSFNNFKYGIYATYYNSTKTVTVNYGTFNNNYRGAYLSGAQFVPTIVSSSFSIMPYNASTASKRAYGLYLNACTDYKVEGNDFTTVGGVTTANNIGCIVNNSGPYTNQVYRNTFHEVWAGVQAQNINCHIQTAFPLDAPNDFGLQNRCNSFTNIREMDMGITSGCIDYQQGLSLSPAANKFSHSNNTTYNDYFTYSSTSSLAFIGYIHNTDFFQSPQSGFYTPPPAIIAANNGLSYNTSAQCQSTLGFHLTPLVSDLKNQIQNYQTLITSLQTLIDAGADISLINAINSSMSAGDLKNLLLSKSPYLSDEVLIAAILRSNPMPSGQIKQIVVANSPVTQPVLDALNSISLSNGIHNQINAVQVGTSERRIAKDEILYYQFQINMNKNDIIREYVNDTTVDVNVDTIINKIIDFEGIDPIGVNRKEALADLYTEKQDYIAAETMIAEIETIPGKQNLAKIKRVNKSLKQSGQTTDVLITDAVNKSKVDEVAADNSNQGFEPATNILQQIFEESYEEPIDDLSPSLHSYIPNAVQAISPIQAIALYPNPNNGLMQLDYVLNEGEVGEFKILDVTGRVVAQYNLNVNEYILQINQSDLSNGVYLYQLLTNGKVVNADKLIIVKE